MLAIKVCAVNPAFPDCFIRKILGWLLNISNQGGHAACVELTCTFPLSIFDLKPKYNYSVRVFYNTFYTIYIIRRHMANMELCVTYCTTLNVFHKYSNHIHD